MIFPFPTGLYSLASISIVSVSQAWMRSGTDFKIYTTLLASSRVLTIVVPSILSCLKASLTPVFKVTSLGVITWTGSSVGMVTFTLGTLGIAAFGAFGLS